MKTLIFCTAFAKTLEDWENLHSRWINAVEDSFLEVDKILIPDDGSPEIPNWEGIDILEEGPLPDQEPEARGIIYHYKNNLGRPSIYNQVGWYRSFVFAAEYARKYGYEKVIHLEADAFVVSKRFQDYLNNFNNGWESFWCPRHQIPETAIEVIAGEKWMNEFFKFIDIDYSRFEGRPPDPGVEQGESYLPYITNKSFIGDRYGEAELMTHVPLNADYACQIRPTTYAWWLNN